MLLSYAFGWFGVSYTKTVGKAQQNAETEVYKSSQTYIDGRLSELERYRLEYIRDTAPDSRQAIKTLLIQHFAGFDNKYLSQDQLEFLQRLRGY